MRNPLFPLLPVLALVATACSGGGSSDGNGDCQTGGFCLTYCDLGCSLSGCSLTEIAENQQLRFVFNEAVEPSSVTVSTFSIRTASGQRPNGDFLVEDNVVTFIPTIRVVGCTTSFGFQRGESYIINLASGSSNEGIRSASGDALSSPLNCTVRATLGVIDENQLPPTATLVSPTDLVNAPTDTSVVLRFNELIDPTPFGASAITAPIRYQLSRGTNNPIQLEGSLTLSVERVGGTNVSVVTLRPSTALPGGATVRIEVTPEVRDLAGVSSPGQLMFFNTEAGSIADQDLVETFASPARQDPQISSGPWSNGARPGAIGGDGRHGSFDITVGTSLGNQVYTWNTDNITIPGTRTISGLPITVTDGRLYFTDFVLAEGFTLRFQGTNPPQIFVRGRVDIAGRIELNGATMSSSYVFRDALATTPVQGQPGGTGGPGGSRGGRGANRCLGTGPIITGGVIQTDGQLGETVRLPAGHAYAARAAGTGGLGSPMFPTTGLNASVQYTILSAFSGQIAPGGGGGGNWTAGTAGSVTPAAGIVAGAAGGLAGAFDNFPVPTGVSSLNHFLVGGSGGGGGGSHCFLAVSGNAADVWKAGAGGSGGGGSIAFRAGNNVLLRRLGVVEAKGGAGAIFSDRVTAGVPSPGGGGSGGSILVQSGNDVTLEGTLDTSGGNGSRTGNIQPVNLNANCFGGPGAPGIYRIEAVGTTTLSAPTLTPAIDPARNQGPLNDRDDLVGCASLWRPTGKLFPPEWKRYVLEVDFNGDGTVDSVYSDDPTVPGSVGLATDPNGPVTIKFQGASVSSTTGQPVAGTVGPWRDSTNAAGGSLNTDNATGFRFQLVFNRRDFPNCIVRNLVVTVRG